VVIRSRGGGSSKIWEGHDRKLGFYHHHHALDGSGVGRERFKSSSVEV